MDNEKHDSFSVKVKLTVAVLWSLTVIGTYHWFNTPYYVEKLSVFFAHLKNVIG